MMTNEEFDEVFNLLCINFPNTKNQQELGTLYFLALGNELTKKEFLEASLKIIKTCKKGFMPQIAEILEIAKKEMDIESQLFFAKKLLKTSIIKYGRVGMISFEDKGLHAVVDYVGWNRLCTMTSEEFEKFLNWEFDGIYKGFLKNPYETSEYYRGSSQLFGQDKPRLVSYEEIGVNSKKINYIPLEYKQSDKTKRIDISKIQQKMLIGG